MLNSRKIKGLGGCHRLDDLRRELLLKRGYFTCRTEIYHVVQPVLTVISRKNLNLKTKSWLVASCQLVYKPGRKYFMFGFSQNNNNIYRLPWEQ